VILLNSCASCWKGGVPLRPTEISSLQAAGSDLKTAKNMKLYYGLAHPKRDKGLYTQQLVTVKHQTFQGFEFHQTPVRASDKLIKAIVHLYSNPDSHQALASPKTTCSGFHPDYAIVWSDNKGQRVLQLCYGCHEWKYFGPGGTLHTDINEPAYFEKLTRWLPPQ
jgi:hypothetical protein